MAVAIAVTVAVVVTVAVAVAVPVPGTVAVPMRFDMRPVFQIVARITQGRARVLTEDQRLDRHRYGLRRHADAAQINVIKVPQHDAVNDQDFAGDVHLFPQQIAQGVGHVAIEDQVQWQPLLEGRRHGPHNTVGEGGDALVGRWAAPAEGQRDFGFAFHQIERLEVATDGLCQLRRIDLGTAFIGRLQHL